MVFFKNNEKLLILSTSRQTVTVSKNLFFTLYSKCNSEKVSNCAPSRKPNSFLMEKTTDSSSCIFNTQNLPVYTG